MFASCFAVGLHDGDAEVGLKYCHLFSPNILAGNSPSLLILYSIVIVVYPS